jgi:hypothetical protein
MLLDRIGATMKPNEQRLFDRTEERLLIALGEQGLADALGDGERLETAGILALSQVVASGGAG